MLDPKSLEAFRGARVVVTGGTGMVGRQVVDLVAGAGARVRVVSLDDVRPHPDAEYVRGDLTDLGFCRSVTKDTDFVFHIAGIKGSVAVTTERPASFLVPLLMMNTNVLEAARDNGVQRLVYTSSIGAYPSREEFHEADAWDGPPMDQYPGWAKRMGELQIRAYQAQYDLDSFAVVRLTNVYGPGDNFDPANAMVIPALMARIAGGENPLLVWGDGSAVREFAYSADVAAGIVLALLRGTNAEPINLGTGQGTSIRELVETLATVVPFDYEFDASKPSGFARRVMNIDAARAQLGYAPATSLRDGLRATWEWYLAHRGEHEQKANYFRESA